MSVQLLSSDSQILPVELLSTVKQHCRVEFDRDDDYLRLATARAISEIENQANRSIAPAEYLWKPVCDCRYVEPPYGPIRSLSYQGDLGDWVPLVWQTAYECGRLRCDWLLTQSVGDGLKLAVGYATAEDIPMDVMSAVLLLTAALYENRESMQFGTLHHLPDQVNRLMAGLWRPSV